MKYLQLLLITLGLNLFIVTTALAADAPASGQGTSSTDSAPDDGTEPECD